MEEFESNIIKLMSLKKKPFDYHQINIQITSLMYSFGSLKPNTLVQRASNLLKENDVIQFLIVVLKDSVDSTSKSNIDLYIKIISNSLNLIGNYYCFISVPNEQTSKILESVQSIFTIPSLTRNQRILNRSLRLIANTVKYNNQGSLIKDELLLEIIKLIPKIKEITPLSSSHEILEAFLRLVKIICDLDKNKKEFIIKKGFFIICDILNWDLNERLTLTGDVLQLIIALINGNELNKISEFSKNTNSEFVAKSLESLIKIYKNSSPLSEIHQNAQSLLMYLLKNMKIVQELVTGGIFHCIFDHIKNTSSTLFLKSEIELLKTLVNKLNNFHTYWIISDPGINSSIGSSLKIFKNPDLKEYHTTLLWIFEHLPKDSLVVLFDSGIMDILNDFILKYNGINTWEEFKIQLISFEENNTLILSPNLDFSSNQSEDDKNNPLFWTLNLLKKLSTLQIGTKEIQDLTPTLLKLVLDSPSKGIWNSTITTLSNVLSHPHTNSYEFLVTHQIPLIIYRIGLNVIGGSLINSEEGGYYKILNKLKHPGLRTYLKTQIQRNVALQQNPIEYGITLSVFGFDYGQANVFFNFTITRILLTELISVIENKKIIPPFQLYNILLCLSLTAYFKPRIREEIPSWTLNEVEGDPFNKKSKTTYTFKFKDGDELYVEEDILNSSNSPVLQVMFNNGFRECNERIVEIKDTTSEVFRIFLTQLDLYPSSIKHEETDYSLNTLFNLLILSQKYISPEIYTRTIGTLLRRNHTPENIYEMYSSSLSKEIRCFYVDFGIQGIKSISTYLLNDIMKDASLRIIEKVNLIYELFKDPSYQIVIFNDFFKLFFVNN